MPRPGFILLVVVWFTVAAIAVGTGNEKSIVLMAIEGFLTLLLIIALILGGTKWLVSLVFPSHSGRYNARNQYEYPIGTRLPISAKLRWEVFDRDGRRCVYCGRGVVEGAILEVDHRRSVFHGGANDIDNLVTACFECNRGKSWHSIGYEEPSSQFLPNSHPYQNHCPYCGNLVLDGAFCSICGNRIR